MARMSVIHERVAFLWGENGYWFNQPADVEPSVAALKEHPFFDSSSMESDLLNPDVTIASAKARSKNVQYDLLARGIPALSFAVAVHTLVPLENQPHLELDRNFNMEVAGRTENQWPSEGHNSNVRDVGRWLHSDFKNVALPYVFQMYQEMINRGSLK